MPWAEPLQEAADALVLEVVWLERLPSGLVLMHSPTTCWGSCVVEGSGRAGSEAPGRGRLSYLWALRSVVGSKDWSM